MLHVASREFYELLSEELRGYSFILNEGVSWRRGRPRPLYEGLAASLGLVAQARALRYPEEVPRINIDLPAEQFRRELGRLPLGQRLLLHGLRPLLGWLSRRPHFRQDFLTWLLSRERGLRRTSPTTPSPLERLLGETRDRHIEGQLREFFEQHAHPPAPTRTAVVFGARHMGGIARCLRTLDFTPERERWMPVLSFAELGAWALGGADLALPEVALPEVGPGPDASAGVGRPETGA